MGKYWGKGGIKEGGGGGLDPISLKHSYVVDYLGMLNGVRWFIIITVLVKYSESERHGKGEDDVVGIGELYCDLTEEPQTSSASISQMMGEHTGKY